MNLYDVAGYQVMRGFERPLAAIFNFYLLKSSLFHHIRQFRHLCSISGISRLKPEQVSVRGCPSPYGVRYEAYGYYSYNQEGGGI